MANVRRYALERQPPGTLNYTHTAAWVSAESALSRGGFECTQEPMRGGNQWHKFLPLDEIEMVEGPAPEGAF
ncbi:MAG: hypothetical protein ACF8Q5_02530 [Phycisphaerales bacterium JB040]